MPCGLASDGSQPVIYYTDNLAAVREDMPYGFFAGWPGRPSAG